MRRVRFDVVGKPEPAGSKTPFKRRDGSVGVRDANPNAKSWQAVVADAALEAMLPENGGPVDPLMDGPVGLAVVFFQTRPKGHFGTGRNAGVLKASAPAYPTTKPDTTKLLRGLEDALTGVVWVDDAQVVEQAVSKRYRDRPGAQVLVWTM